MSFKRGFLRGVEAAIAVMIMLMAFQFLYTVRFSFHPHETRILSNIANSALQTYHSTITHYVSTADLASLNSLMGSVIPPGFGYKMKLDYYQPLHVLFGSTGYRSNSFTTDFPYSVDSGSPLVKNEEGVELDTQIVWSWYRIPFKIVNDEQSRDYSSLVHFELKEQDTNQDGELEQVVRDSAYVSLNVTDFDYEIVNISRVNQTDVAYFNFSMSLSENQVADGYVYYKVIS